MVATREPVSAIERHTNATSSPSGVRVRSRPPSRKVPERDRDEVVPERGSDEVVDGRALRCRTSAKGARGLAKAEHESEACEREELRLDREHALPHGSSRLIAERITSKLAQQRIALIERQLIPQLGSWHWDVVTDMIDWSDELCRIYGLRPGQHPASFAQYLECLHPDDRSDVRAALQAAYASGEPFAFKHRIVRPDGSVRVLNGLGEVVCGVDGQVRRMHGTGQDITDAS